MYAPVAPTKECLGLLQELIVQYGPVQTIILPSVAVEHKVLAGPFARKFPDATFYVVDQQYSFPLPLPSLWLGLPRWARPLPRSGSIQEGFEHEVLTVKPGPGSYFQDVALYHKRSKTLCVCDAVLAVTAEPLPPPSTEAMLSGAVGAVCVCITKKTVSVNRHLEF